ncbi:MAG: hypothetical protein WBE34_17660 [Candidatus Nitrosopolaris sp.]
MTSVEGEMAIWVPKVGDDADCEMGIHNETPKLRVFKSNFEHILSIY